LKGDTLIILSYSGEGIYDVWCKGKRLDVEAFWNTDDSDYVGADSSVALTPTQIDSLFRARLVCPSRMTWWVNLTNQRGEIGWFPIPNSCAANGAVSKVRLSAIR